MKLEKYQEIAKTFRVIYVNGHKHVIGNFDRFSKVYPAPNYRNTGAALIGVLKKDQSLAKFTEHWLKVKEQIINTIDR